MGNSVPQEGDALSLSVKRHVCELANVHKEEKMCFGVHASDTVQFHVQYSVFQTVIVRMKVKLPYSP